MDETVIPICTMKNLKSNELQKGYSSLGTKTWQRSFSDPIIFLDLLLAPFSGFEPVRNIVFIKQIMFFFFSVFYLSLKMSSWKYI